MEVVFTALSNKALFPEKNESLISFFSPEPLVIQPGEIRKVKTYLSLDLNLTEGTFLFLETPRELLDKFVSLFPQTPCIDSGPFDISLHNCGQSQVNILPEKLIAIGRILTKLITFSLSSLEYAPNKEEKKKRLPIPARGDKFKFEIK